MKKRQHIPRQAELAVLSKSRRRCALCVGLEGDLVRKKGQIAHTDHDRGNAAEDNLAWLCVEHHDEYDSKTSQTKNITRAELIQYRNELYELMREPNWPGLVEPLNSGARSGVDANAYELRRPAYEQVRSFLHGVVANAAVEWENLRGLAAGTDQALFLFGWEIDEWIVELYKKGVRLRLVGMRMKALQANAQLMGANEHEWSELVEEEADILEWFTERMAEIRNVFAKSMMLK